MKHFLYIADEIWSLGPQMIFPRWYHACCVVVNKETDDILHIVAGGKTKDWFDQIKVVEIFNTNTEQWSLGPPLPQGS